MSYHVDLQFHDTARGNETTVLWRSRLPDSLATAGAAFAAGRRTLDQMGRPLDAVSFRIVDDAGNIFDVDDEDAG